MEGVLDESFREVFTGLGGYSFSTTEFVRVTEGVLSSKTWDRLCPELNHNSRTPSGTPVFVQLLGGSAETLALNASAAADRGAYGIDLNFGCPAPTVNRHDGGAAILREPKRVFEITQSVRRAVPLHLPVTVKIRLGYEHTDDALVIARAAEDGGASWLAVHGRTKLEGYRPIVHWDKIGEIRESLSIPVIANGEIWNRAQAKECIRVTGCERLLLARGAVANPFLAREILEDRDIATWPLMLALVSEVIELSRSRHTANYALRRMKQWVRLLIPRFEEAHDLFEKIKRLDNCGEALLVLAGEREMPETPTSA